MKLCLDIIQKIVVVILIDCYSVLAYQENNSKTPLLNTDNHLCNQQLYLLNQQALKDVNNQNYTHALLCYQKILDMYPNYEDVLLKVASLKTRLKCFDESENILINVLSKNLKQGEAWFLLGVDYMMEQRYEVSFAALAQSLCYQPGNAKVHNYFGIVAQKKGWLEVAEDELRKAVEIDPNYADAHFNLAVLYLAKNPPMLELAHRHYQESIDLGATHDSQIEEYFVSKNHHSTN